MTKGPLKGIKVVELTTTLAGPAAGCCLSDWGADVIKIEPLRGDSFRNVRGNFGASGDVSSLHQSPPFFCVNRGKKSVTLDLQSSIHLNAAFKLISQADVFLTNVRQQQLQNFELNAESLHKRFPRLIYCALTGYGLVGPDKDEPGYDVGCFYGRSGAAYTFIPNHPKYGAIQTTQFRKGKIGKDSSQSSSDGLDLFEYPPILPAGFGDISTGLVAAGGICAALIGRAKTGKGEIVDTSLLHSGMWINLWTTMNNLSFFPRKMLGERSRQALSNPLINMYRAGCGKLFYLLALQSDRHFPSIAKALGKEEWLTDSKYNSARKRAKSTLQFTWELERLFEAHPLSYWKARFKQFDVWWQPINTVAEAIEDDQFKALDAITEIPLSDQDRAEGTKNIKVVRSPVNFSRTPLPKLGAVPSLGEHTEQVLLSAGLEKEVVNTIVNDLGKNRKAKL